MPVLEIEHQQMAISEIKFDHVLHRSHQIRMRSEYEPGRIYAPSLTGNQDNAG